VSWVVHDSTGKPLLDPNGLIIQFFVDAEGNVVRSPSGKRIHVEIDFRVAGRVVRDSNGNQVFVEVDLPDESFDHLGNPLAD
jgi:hypothetical protein